MFKKYFYKRRLKRILEDKNPTKRERCLNLIELLEGEKLSKQKFDSLFNLKFTMLYPNIVAYSRKLKEINFQIERKTLISSDMVSNAPTIVVLDSFFTDENNCYVEVTKSFESFIKECTRLLTLLADSDTAEYGYFEHTARVLRNVLLNIEEVLIKITVSLQE